MQPDQEPSQSLTVPVAAGLLVRTLAHMLKLLRYKFTDGQIQIQDYPDAVALKRIDTPIAQQLKAVTLHQIDLMFCRDALAEIARLNRTEHETVVEALWVASIARYFKCFGGNKSRSQLSADKIFREHLGAKAVFTYFQDLRDKHVIHDENPFTQAFTGVAVNRPEAPCKVADIIAFSFNVLTVDEAHLKQLTQLVDLTLDWVVAKQTELHKNLADEFEQWPRERLLELPDIQFTVPTAKDARVKR